MSRLIDIWKEVQRPKSPEVSHPNGIELGKPLRVPSAPRLCQSGAMAGTVREQIDFIRKNARWLVAGFLQLMFSSFGQAFFIGLAGIVLRERFDLSGGAFGAIYMVATLASAATFPWLGRRLDIMPGWKVTRFVMPALAVACL